MTTTAVSEREALSPPQVGRILGVAPSTVIAFIRSGELRAANLGMKRQPRFRILRADLDEFLKGRQQHAKDVPSSRSAPSRRPRIDGIKEFV
jgi:excisionase family DNA binding protein